MKDFFGKIETILKIFVLMVLAFFAAFTVSVVSLVIGGVLGNVYISFILYSASNSLVYAVYGFGFMRYNGLSFKKMFKIFMESFFKCLPLILMLIILKVFVNINELQIVIISLGLLGSNYVILAIKTPEIKKICKESYSKLKTKYYAKQ